jgi:hypothetical protein
LGCGGHELRTVIVVVVMTTEARVVGEGRDRRGPDVIE